MKIWKIIVLAALLTPTAFVFGIENEKAQPPEDDVMAPPPPPDNKSVTPEEQRRRDRRFERDMLKSLPDAERERLKKLFVEDPDKFRSELMKIIFERQKRDFDEVMKLRNAYMNADTPEKKSEAKAALRKLLSDQYYRHLGEGDRRIKENEQRIAAMRAEIDVFKRHLEERKKNAEATIDKTLKRFTDPSTPPSKLEMRMPPPNERAQSKTKK